MKKIYTIIFLICTIFVFISCNKKEEAEIPSAVTAIFIDINGLQLNSINKANSPNFDIVLRSGVEVLLSNPDSLKGYDLLALSPESKFIEIAEKFLRRSSKYYLTEHSDSITIFEEAANILAEHDPMFIYIDVTMNSDSLQSFDAEFGVLLDKINYSARFDKTLIVLMFNAGIEAGNQLKVLVNGPKIRKGAEVEGVVNAIDLNTSILKSMDINMPDDWSGTFIEYLFLKEYRE